MLGRLVVSPLERRGVPGCMIVLYAYPSATQTLPAPESNPAFSSSSGPEPGGVTPSMFGRKKLFFLFLCLEERRGVDCIIFHT